MEKQLARHVKVAFGFAFDVEKSRVRRSGFMPADIDLGGKKPLLGQQRLEGFSALLKIGFADRLVLVGGNEGRYTGELPVINRAVAIKQMLEEDFGIDSSKIEAYPSASNTGGNIAIIKEVMAREGLDPKDCAGVSSAYHLMRINFDLLEEKVPIQCYPAEAFLLLQFPDREAELLKRFDGNQLSPRTIQEIKGMADKVLGTYVPRTDTQPVPA